MALFAKAKLESDLLARVEALERSNKAIRIEWDEMFDKFRILLARLAKRAKDELRRAENEDAGVSSAPTMPQAPRSPTDRITNPLARRLLQRSSNGGDE